MHVLIIMSNHHYIQRTLLLLRGINSLPRPDSKKFILHFTPSKWLISSVLVFFSIIVSPLWGQFSDLSKDVQWTPEGLSFENFRVVQPARKTAKLSVGAVTSSRPGVEVSVRQQDLQSILDIKMSNRFNYNKSWISADAVNDTALLQHEQGHFDLNEIYTRKTFEQLRKFHFTTNFKNEIAQIMGAMNSELTKVQQNYERETVHGLMAQNQQSWNNRIRTTLQSLPPYEGQTFSQTLPPADPSAKEQFQ